MSGGGSPSSVANGANPDDFGDGPTGVNFFASIVGNPAGTSGSSVLLFFDDNGRNNDDNHDDMVVRLSVAAIPVPATLPLICWRKAVPPSGWNAPQREAPGPSSGSVRRGTRGNASTSIPRGVERSFASSTAARHWRSRSRGSCPRSPPACGCEPLTGSRRTRTSRTS